MSDTPRTDALDFGDQSIFPGPGYGQLWELARQLERELSQVKAILVKVEDERNELLRMIADDEPLK